MTPQSARAIAATWREDADEYRRLALVAQARKQPMDEKSYLDMEDDLRDRIEQLEAWADAWEAEIRAAKPSPAGFYVETPPNLFSIIANEQEQILEHIIGVKEKP